MRPGESPHFAAKAATAATLRRAVLDPYDVVVLAAVEAANHETGRQVPADTTEIVQTANVDVVRVGMSLESLRRQRLVNGDGQYWALTPLGVEVLGELIRKERRQGPRR